MNFDFWVSVGLLWLLFFHFYRKYRVDRLRESLFAVRDELFDLASTKELAFDNPAYGYLRSRINHSIQYADELSLMDFVCHQLIRGRVAKSASTAYARRRLYEQALDQLPDQMADSLRKVEVRYLVHIMVHVLLTSLLFWLLIIPAISFAVISTLCKELLQRCAVSKPLRSFVDEVDEASRMGAMFTSSAA